MGSYPKLRMRSLGIEDNDVGNSSTALLKRFKISKLVRLAKAGGTTDILLCVRVMRVRLYMVTKQKSKMLLD